MKITLCGSTRFRDLFASVNEELTLNGHTVYSLGLYGREASDKGKEGCVDVTENEKILLDLVHLSKIEESDAIVVLDKDSYIGFSTKREIIWARMRGKKVFWFEPGKRRFDDAHYGVLKRMNDVN